MHHIIFPLSLIHFSSAPDHFSLSLKFILFEGAFVGIVVGPFHFAFSLFEAHLVLSFVGDALVGLGAEAMRFSFFPFSVVYYLFGGFVVAFAFHIAIDPISFEYLSVGEYHSAFALRFVVGPVSFVECIIWHDLSSLSMFPIVD